MVLLTTADGATARILAAHLGAEGVVWQLRGNVEGPYPVGPVEVLVDEHDLDRARDLLDAQVAEPLDESFDAGPGESAAVAMAGGPARPARVGPWVLLAVIGVPLVVALVRLIDHVL